MDLYTRGGHKANAQGKYVCTQEDSTKQTEGYNTW